MNPVHLRAFKSNKPHMNWAAELIAQSGDWILTHTPISTSVRHHTRDLTYAMKHSCFGIFNTKEYYNLFIDFNADGSFKMLYVNIATPAILKGEEITWTDLELDIVRLPGKPAEIIDIDEFEAAKANNFLSQELADKAEAVAFVLIDAVNEARFPFLVTNRNDSARFLSQRLGVDLGQLV